MRPEKRLLRERSHICDHYKKWKTKPENQIDMPVTIILCPVFILSRFARME